MLAGITDKVTVIQAAYVTDAHGNPSYDWDNPVGTWTRSAYVGENKSIALSDRDYTIVASGTITAVMEPISGVELNNTEFRILWHDVAYRLDGSVEQRWANGALHHWSLPLKLIV